MQTRDYSLSVYIAIGHIYCVRESASAVILNKDTPDKGSAASAAVLLPNNHKISTGSNTRPRISIGGFYRGRLIEHGSGRSLARSVLLCCVLVVEYKGAQERFSGLVKGQLIDSVAGFHSRNIVMKTIPCVVAQLGSLRCFCIGRRIYYS